MAVPLPETTGPESLETAAAAPAPRGRIRSRLPSLDIALPAGVLLLVAGACFIWPLIGPVGPPTGGSILDSNLPIGSPHHILGTDPVGNDVWSRLLYGGRVSFEVAFAVSAIGLLGGGLLGAVAGYVGGFLDGTIMRVLDVLIAFPALVIALAIAEGLGPGELHVIWALLFFSIPAFARLARAETLRLREQTFMLAARLSGTRTWRVLMRHVAPNIVPQLLTFALLGSGIIITLEGALSFFGLSVPEPNPSWGNMIATGQGVLSAQPSLVLVPSIALFITVVAFNMLGDGLRSHWSSR